MEEESGFGSSTDEGNMHMNASSRSDSSVGTNSNGHFERTKNDGTERRVDPLKIRLTPKIHHDGYGKNNKARIKPVPRKKEPGKLFGNHKQHNLEWKAIAPVLPKIAKIAPKSFTPRLLPDDISKPIIVPIKKSEKGGHVKEYAQSLGLQPTVKFKCRKCSSMSFKSLLMLKEHQRLCKAHTSGGDDETSVISGSGTTGRVTKKVYLCSSCSTYYENCNLFLHMREVHNRHICLYCLGMFSKAERLASHLFIKHSVAEQTFSGKESLQVLYDGSVYLTCCTCDKLFTEKDNYSVHSCTIPAQSKLNVKSNQNVSVTPAAPICDNAISDNNSNSDITQDVSLKTKDEEPDALLSKGLNTKENDLLSTLSPIQHIDDPIKADNENNQFSENLNSSLSESTSEKDTSLNTQEEVNNTADDSNEDFHKIDALPKETINSTNHDSESTSSDDGENASSMCLDSPKNENNNVSVEKGRDVGIKLKLSLNNASSPVIINSTVRPENEPKPSVRPNRPPGGRIVAPGEPIPPPASINSHLLSTIYDNKADKVNSLNRVPKLTVRVPKGLLDKDSSSDESSDSDVSDRLTVDDTVVTESTETTTEDKSSSQIQPIALDTNEDLVTNNSPTAEVPPVEEVTATDITLDRPLDKYPLKELLKVCVAGTMYYCVYCNHVRKIAINCKQLALHMLDAHRFSATVNSITAEELLPETIKQRIRADLDEVDSIFVNLDTYDSVNPCKLLPYVRTYECFQCYFITTVHKDLYLHNRKMHQKTILLCIMCKSNFYSYSELLCHLCPGTYDSEYEMKFRCCMCNIDNIPSAFRLMVHLRKVHHACDVCSEVCLSQAQLSMHVWKHKLHHLCYRCGIAYRNKADITKHLFWKHGTESVLCKRCLQKKWPHVYHFCIPPTRFMCEECNENFSKAVCLKVHKRFHSETYPHQCTEDGCGDKFVSKKLLAKHMLKHEESKTEKSCIKPDSIDLTESKESSETVTVDAEEVKSEGDSETKKKESESPENRKKIKKKKNKEKDNFLLDVNLPALNLSESDSSEESDTSPVISKLEDTNTVKVTINFENANKVEHIKELEDERQIEDTNKLNGPSKLEETDQLEDTSKLEETNKLDGTNKLEDTSKIDKTKHENLSKVEDQSNDEDINKLEELETFNKLEIGNSDKAKIEDTSKYKIEDTSKPKIEDTSKPKIEEIDENDKIQLSDLFPEPKVEEKPISDQASADIWDNFKQYQAKIEKQKTPPLMLIRKHVCESDHDYCIVPNDMNGDFIDDLVGKKHKKKSPRKKLNKNSTGSSSSSSSSSSSDSCCSRGSKCSCSSSSGSSSSSSSDSDSSSSVRDKKRLAKSNFRRRDSNGSHSSAVDVMGVEEHPLLIPEKKASPIPETDLETEETDTDEEFYDEHPQRLANKLHAEKKNQLMLLASVAPSDNGSVAGDLSRPITPEKVRSPKKKRKTKKRKKSSKFKQEPIKLNIPKEVIGQTRHTLSSSLNHNKLTISLHSNIVQIPHINKAGNSLKPTSSGHENKRASKRRRVPNKFYGYSSDEETMSKQPHLMRSEWKKEEALAPLVINKPQPSISHKMRNYDEPIIRMSTPVPDPVPPPILMNTESMESSDTASSDERELQIDHSSMQRNSVTFPPSQAPGFGSSYLPVSFPKPAGVRQAREGESVYCYCRCPYDEVSEMIACDAIGCDIEWFHFECVGIMVPPKGKWYCPDCRQKQGFM